MPSTYSTNLKLELIGTGDQSGTWGNTTNTNLGTLIEEAICGVGTVVIPNADTTITIADGASSEARKIVLTVTGTLTAARNLIVPTINKVYIVHNNTAGGYAVTVKTSAGSGVAVPSGQKRLLYVNSTNVVEGINSTGDLNVNGNISATGAATITGSLSYNGFTPPTSSTGSGAMVLSASPTLTTPNLGTPSSVTLTNATGLPLTSAVIGSLPILNGGTGQTTATSAFNALAPSQSGQSGKFLSTDGLNTSWTSPTAAASSITVGTTSVLGATDGQILYRNGGALGATTLIPLSAGGTGAGSRGPAFDALSPMTNQGDMIYGVAGGSGFRLGIGANGQVLTSNGSAPYWATPAVSGTITGVAGSSTASGLTLSGGGTTGNVTLTLSGTAIADANSLTGTTLKSTVTASSLTSVGTLSSLTVSPTGTANITNASITNLNGTTNIPSGSSLYVQSTVSQPGYGNTNVGGTWITDPANGPSIYSSRTSNPSISLNCNSDSSVMAFYKSGSNVGYIAVTSTNTVYSTTSDYRLKENFEPITNALDRLSNLNVYRFNWKSDPTGPKVDGFIAHEVTPVVPEAIFGKKDAVNEDGSIKPQGIDQSKLVPLLVAALQEANQKIDALTARVTALENK